MLDTAAQGRNRQDDCAEPSVVDLVSRIVGNQQLLRQTDRRFYQFLGNLDVLMAIEEGLAV